MWRYVSINIVKGIFVVGSHTVQRLGLRNGNEEWELLLLEVQALLCPWVTLWYIRLVYGQLMKWPA